MAIGGAQISASSATNATGGGTCEHGRAVFLYVPFPERVNLAELATEALARGLAACVNVVAGRSIYLWEGRTVDEPEQLAWFKTTPAQESALRQFIEERHPYSLPCLASFRPDVNPAFGSWIESCVSGAGQDTKPQR